MLGTGVLLSMRESGRIGVIEEVVEKRLKQREAALRLVRALRTLDIESIHANSPQAKGRVERANRTLQDRLVKEMRLRGIGSLEAGNACLPAFMADYNRRFAVAPRNPNGCAPGGVAQRPGIGFDSVRAARPQGDPTPGGPLQREHVPDHGSRKGLPATRYNGDRVQGL